MATLSVKFIKTTHRDGALYCDKQTIACVSVVGKRMASEEKKNGYELAYYCRKTKSQSECWLIKDNDHWFVYGGKDMFPNPFKYDTIVVN